MLFKIIGLLLVILTLSCNSEELNIHGQKYVKNLFVYNNSYQHRKLSDTKLIQNAITQIKSIISNECPSIIDINTLTIILPFSLSTDLSIHDSRLIYKCLDSIGFDQAELYSEFVSLLPAWGEKMQSMYLILYRDYIPLEEKVLGIIEFAKINCSDESVRYLAKNNYPLNAKQLMTEKEYKYFSKYSSEQCKK